MATDHIQEEFQRLVEDDEILIEAAARTEDVETRRSLLDVLVLMAVCDGELTEEEREFLGKISKRLEPPLDLKKVEKRAPRLPGDEPGNSPEDNGQCQGGGHYDRRSGS